MHSLAIALQKIGHQVSGSDDEIYNPSHSRLKEHGLLPTSMGWDALRITDRLDAVILGMHAKIDNPELQAAQQLGIPIYSYPSYLAELCREKHRIVIAGSHGKTTITAMIMQGLKETGRDFDYLVGAPVDGFDSCLRLSDAPLIIIEGDEYPSSALDVRAKFLLYEHHIGLVSGIAWDHINFYPTADSYLQSFEAFAHATPKGGNLVYNDEDPHATAICTEKRSGVQTHPYSYPNHHTANEVTYVTYKSKNYPLSIFGRHNLNNLAGAAEVLELLAVEKEVLYPSITSFKGAEKRLTLLASGNQRHVYSDWAHAPSKVAASTQAVKERYPKAQLIAILELHTFSSLSEQFTPHYKNALSAADLALIYINPQVISTRKGHAFTQEGLQEAFDHKQLTYLNDKEKLLSRLQQEKAEKAVFLFMSSGNFDNLDLRACAQHLVEKPEMPSA